MKDINPYLMFDGNTRDAMTFYKECLGAELQLMTFAEAPVTCPPGADAEEFKRLAKDRVMHAKLTKGSIVVMASDNMPGMHFLQGNNFSININCESLQEIQSLFAALGEKGRVTCPLQDMFWGAHFGMLNDQFGVQWMFNFERPKQA